ncbi:MAG: amidohydrolase family protein, partial [Candidatus Eremiobacteraeota bacterium]|nr:amidohydrolase family protein [Candidatus Eremiobacteraeota bacterium]
MSGTPLNDAYTIGPARIAFGDGTAREAVLAIERDRIAAVLDPSASSDYMLAPGTTVAPGLIDVHTNGAGDLLFLRDWGNAVEAAARAYVRQGATGFVAAIMTAPWESMMRAAGEVSESANAIFEQQGAIGARCLGIHFEGPFINPKFRRVHRGDFVIRPTPAKAREMVEACRGTLVMVTMAPEVEGVDDAARFLFEQGIVCSAGHTAARYREGMLAIGFGFRSLTHAFNAMPPLDHREPSLLLAFMQEKRTTVQLICDGYHVAPPMVDLLYRIIGERLVLASDNMPPVGSGYHVKGGVVRAEDGTIAGSALECDQAVRNLMSYADIPFERAIVNATRTPATMLGLDHEIGLIAPGMRADLSLWDADVQVVATIVGGVPVFGASALNQRPAR